MNDQVNQHQAIRTFSNLFLAFVLIVGLLAGYTLGSWGHDRTKEQLATLQVDTAKADTATAYAGYERLEAAVIRSNYLEKALLESETLLRKLSEEKRNAVKNHTTGSTCLNGDAVRLLNADTTTAADMPATVSGPAAAGGAASSDPDVEADREVATDTNVADWAITVKEQYGICRQRLQRLIDWFPSDSIHPFPPNE